MTKSSFLYWYPKIQNLGIPMPKTEIVEIPYAVFLKYMDEPMALAPYVHEIKEKSSKIGYPLFLKTDLASGKHQWEKSCYVPSEKDLAQHIWEVVEFNFCADFMGLPCQALLLREFIKLDWKFKAFSGMPVAKERRYFVRDGRVVCHHEYWIKNAIEDWHKRLPSVRVLPKNWEALLKEINTETDDEICLLTDYSERVAKVLDGYWSIDYAKAKNGIWYLIDAAEGEKSYHLPHEKQGHEPQKEVPQKAGNLFKKITEKPANK
ncbi:MAG: ATP-grasp domain-containing protein [Caldisericia bacterium]